MNKSIFPILSLNRNKYCWADHLLDPTPVEYIGDMYFKRDDYFAPLGYGFINGMKVRQGIYIFENYIKGKKTGIVGGMPINSPQHSFQAVVAHYYNVDSFHIIGSTKPETAICKEDINIAVQFGATFKIVQGAYNIILQKHVKEFEDENPNVYKLDYAISLNHKTHTAKEITNWHLVSAQQVKNMPEHIENLVVPTGSGNSTTSILLGLILYPPKNLKKIFMIGIGPQKLRYIEERLKIIKHYLGIKHDSSFNRHYTENENIEQEFQEEYTSQYELYYDDLHKKGLVKYGIPQEESYENINFHPNYEAKVWRALKTIYKKDLINNKTCFWIIGSKPSISALSEKEIPYPYDKMKITSSTPTIFQKIVCDAN